MIQFKYSIFKLIEKFQNSNSRWGILNELQLQKIQNVNEEF